MKASLTLESWKASNILVRWVTSRSFLNGPELAHSTSKTLSLSFPFMSYGLLLILDSWCLMVDEFGISAGGKLAQQEPLKEEDRCTTVYSRAGRRITDVSRDPEGFELDQHLNRGCHQVSV